MSTHRSRTGTRASILAGAVALALSFAAQAQDLTFDIGAGDLKAALDVDRYLDALDTLHP